MRPKIKIEEAAWIAYEAIHCAEITGDWMDCGCRPGPEWAWMKDYDDAVRRASIRTGGALGAGLGRLEEASFGAILGNFTALLEAPPSGAKQHAAFVAHFAEITGHDPVDLFQVILDRRDAWDAAVQKWFQQEKMREMP